jgi:transposase-like protein
VFRVARPAPGVAADRRAVYIDILGFSVRVPVTTGVSAIACWQPTRKSRLWFGLRLISKRSVHGRQDPGSMKSLRCPNRSCQLWGKVRAGSIIRSGFYTTKSGKRRRFRCRTCHNTFCSNTATPYHRLQHRRATFDDVAALSVEGLNKSAIARVKRIAWNTVHRWCLSPIIHRSVVRAPEIEASPGNWIAATSRTYLGMETTSGIRRRSRP